MESFNKPLNLNNSFKNLQKKYTHVKPIISVNSKIKNNIISPEVNKFGDSKIKIGNIELFSIKKRFNIPKKVQIQTYSIDDIIDFDNIDADNEIKLLKEEFYDNNC
jgi:hypothetical protein